MTLHETEFSITSGTLKRLFLTEDGYPVESVVLPGKGGRKTLCLSSQAGCPIGCVFCATGKLGLKRNLNYQEILYQAQGIEGLTNLVYMGMGEPFLNYEELLLSLQEFTNQKSFSIAPRRITVSTAGIVPGILRLAEDFPQIGLALSLHTTDQALRSTLMPGVRAWPLEDVHRSLVRYSQKSPRRVFFEVIMISGVTDSVGQARDLARWIDSVPAQVNLIPWHPGAVPYDLGFAPSSLEVMRDFQKQLRDLGVGTTIRASLGADIHGACGQLAGKF